MFERITQTEADKDAEAAEGRTRDQIISIRTAAVLVLANAILALGLALVFRVESLPVVQIVVSLFLAFYLYRLRPRAEALALGFSLLGILVSLWFFIQANFVLALVQALPIWATAGALLLLLTGDPHIRRRVVAVLIFFVFNVGPYLLAVIGKLAAENGAKG